MNDRAATKTAAPRLRLRVSAAAETTLREGHPWVFADSVREQNRPGTTGELAVIYDKQDRFLAIGLFDSESPIRVRVLHAGKPQTIDGAWWTRRFGETSHRRKGLFDSETTGYRWINGESDSWPGLVLDRYDQTLVLKLYTAAWLPHLSRLLEVFREQLDPERLVLRLSRNMRKTAAEACSFSDGETLVGPPITGPVVFLETGLRFEAEVLQGQKTGFFLDQRENRRHVQALSEGRHVLNTFSFSGAFSVYAARGGARSVTDVDISRHALASGARNFALNQSVAPVAACTREEVQADVFDWLGSATRKFDLVILDPPSLAKREAERAGAIRAYERLARLGLEHLSAGGILVACSCSAHVSADEFFQSVRRSAASAGKFLELQTTTQPADHPATIPEARYLKAIYLQRQKGSYTERRKSGR